MSNVITKQSFLSEKLNNLIKWIISDNIFDKDHSLVQKLKEFQKDYNTFLLFLMSINGMADSKGQLTNNQIETFLSIYNIQLKSFKDDQIIKFSKYLQCFILTLRC